MTTSEKSIQFTRKQYLDGDCTHSQYYSQFVDVAMKSRVLIRFGIDKIKAAFAEDEHLNNIPIAYWDGLAVPFTAYAANAMRLAGDYPTLAGGVCIAKEAARQLI